MAQVAFIPFSFPGMASVGCAFTSRQGGASVYPYFASNISYDVGDDPAAVSANREAIKQRLGLTELVDCTQVHQDAVVFELAEGRPCTGDGLATRRSRVGLMVKTADCQPILLAHETGRFVAGLHVGWRGNVMNFPGSGVRAVCERYDCDPAELFAVRGPSLGPQRAEFTNFESEFGPAFADYHDPDAGTVNLWRLTCDQLAKEGLRPERIHGIDMCTMSLPEVFFSYRGEKTTGRQAGIIWIK